MSGSFGPRNRCVVKNYAPTSMSFMEVWCFIFGSFL